MSSAGTRASSSGRPGPVFATTRWSDVLAAGGGDPLQGQEALARLCQTYWYPLYAYARRRGASPTDAQDLTQEFFARLLAGNWLAQADRDRGRFRSFLLTAMKHFLANEWNRTHTQKRGGNRPIFSLDEIAAEERYQLEPADTMTPELLYERGWALTLLHDVLGRLEQEYARAGKRAWMEVLRPCLSIDRDKLRYDEIAGKLGVTEPTARVAVHRLRQRYRRLLQAEVAGTVADTQDVAQEMAHLFQVLAGN